jgi:hypothetical protein
LCKEDKGSRGCGGNGTLLQGNDDDDVVDVAFVEEHVTAGMV